MSRLAAYMAEIARLMGCLDSVHFDRIEEGSVAIVALAQQEDVAIISPRVRAVSGGDVNAEGAGSWRKINEYLSEDGWRGEMQLPRSSEVIEFPGKTRTVVVLRSMSQSTSIQGRLIRLEGAGDMVRVGLEIDGGLTARISLDAHNAQKLAAFFHQYVRLSGEGRWKRDADGKWSLESLAASSFEVLQDDELKHVLHRLGETIPPGTGKTIVSAVNELRSA